MTETKYLHERSNGVFVYSTLLVGSVLSCFVKVKILWFEVLLNSIEVEDKTVEVFWENPLIVTAYKEDHKEIKHNYVTNSINEMILKMT